MFQNLVMLLGFAVIIAICPAGIVYSSYLGQYFMNQNHNDSIGKDGYWLVFKKKSTRGYHYKAMARLCFS